MSKASTPAPTVPAAPPADVPQASPTPQGWELADHGYLVRSTKHSTDATLTFHLGNAEALDRITQQASAMGRQAILADVQAQISRHPAAARVRAARSAVAALNAEHDRIDLRWNKIGDELTACQYDFSPAGDDKRAQLARERTTLETRRADIPGERVKHDAAEAAAMMELRAALSAVFGPHIERVQAARQKAVAALTKTAQGLLTSLAVAETAVAELVGLQSIGTRDSSIAAIILAEPVQDPAAKSA